MVNRLRSQSCKMPRLRPPSAACRLLGPLFGLLLGAPPVYMWVATPAPGRVVLAGRPLDQTQVYDIYVANWGYHTSVILEQPPGWRLGPPGAETAAFVEYSWGDRNFYMAFQRDPFSALIAALLPTESVLFVRGWQAAPSLADGIEQLYRRPISAEQWRRLTESFEQEFRRTAEGQRQAALLVQTPYSGHFYAGRRFYIGWSACNAWTVRNLATIDAAQDRWGIIWAEQVSPQLYEFEQIQQSDQHQSIDTDMRWLGDTKTSLDRT